MLKLALGLSTINNITFRKILFEKTISKPNFPGENFIAIVTTDVMTTMADTARELLMSHTNAQWLYVISDTDIHNGNISGLINALHEGENVAYIYNITDDDPGCKVRKIRFICRIINNRVAWLFHHTTLFEFGQSIFLYCFYIVFFLISLGMASYLMFPYCVNKVFFCLLAFT